MNRRATTGSAVEIVPGEVYASHDGQELALDAYLPNRTGPVPGFLLFHGGAWTKGSRDSYASWGRFFARHGYAAFSVEYRLARPGAPTFPQIVWDGKAALQFVRGHAERYRLDPDRLGVMGGSAGAYLAAMLALTASDPTFDNPYPDAFRDQPTSAPVAVCIAGTYDLLQRWEHDQLDRPPGESAAELFLGGTPMNARRRYYEASPIFHASEQNARGTKWLLSWGTEDDVSPPETHAKPFSQHLKRAGALVRHVPVPGAPHFWYLEGEVDEGPYLPLLTSRVLTFLETWSGW